MSHTNRESYTFFLWSFKCFDEWCKLLRNPRFSPVKKFQNVRSCLVTVVENIKVPTANHHLFEELTLLPFSNGWLSPITVGISMSKSFGTF